MPDEAPEVENAPEPFQQPVADEGFAAPTSDDETPRIFFAQTYGPLKGAGALEMERPAILILGAGLDAPSVDAAATTTRPAEGGTSVELLARLDGAPAGLRLRHGRGSVVALSSASAFLNDALRQGRGAMHYARLLRAVAPDPATPVYFDEYHLGIGGARSIVRYLRQLGGGAILLQLLVLLAIVALRYGRRFGGLAPDPEPIPGGTASYVAGTSALYARSGDRVGVAGVLFERALLRIATAHRIAERSAGGVAESLGRLGRLRAAEAVQELAAMENARPSSDAALVAYAERLDQFVVAALVEAGPQLMAAPIPAPSEDGAA